MSNRRKKDILHHALSFSSFKYNTHSKNKVLTEEAGVDIAITHQGKAEALKQLRSVSFHYDSKLRRRVNNDIPPYIGRLRLPPVTVKHGKHSMTYKDTKKAWNALRLNSSQVETCGTPEEKRSIRTVIDSLSEILEHNIKITKPRDEVLPEYADYGYALTLEQSNNCYYCNRQLELCKELTHTCRICDQSFHENCVIKHCKEGLSIKALNESTTEIGWSCPQCETLTGFLTDEESEEILQIFETLSGTLSFYVITIIFAVVCTLGFITVSFYCAYSWYLCIL